MAEETTKIDVGGHELRYRLSGEGDRTIILLHGFAETIDVWNDIVPELQSMGRVLLLELRAHGWSGSPKPPYQWEDLAGDVLKAMDGLDIAAADIVGHGLGGLVALHVSRIDRSRVSSLVVIGDGMNATPAQQTLFNEIVKSGRMNGLEGIAHALFGPISREKVEGRPMDLTAVAALVQRLAEETVAPTLAAVSSRTLCLAGERDVSWPERMQAIANGIEGAATASIADVGEVPHVAKPVETAAEIRKFIEAAS
jgi:pimeloyl-ACP methyl ester carboxylesterase